MDDPSLIIEPSRRQRRRTGRPQPADGQCLPVAGRESWHLSARSWMPLQSTCCALAAAAAAAALPAQRSLRVTGGKSLPPSTMGKVRTSISAA